MIIAVASGKGGTGKTLVATSLALSLKSRHQVQLLDCDVEEPNDHIFLKPVITSSVAVSIPVPHIDEAKCTYCGRCAQVCVHHAIAVLGEHVLTFSQLCHGCGACSYLCPEKAITEEARKIGVVESGEAAGIAFAQGRLKVGEPMAPPVIRRVKEQAADSRIVIIDAPPGTSCPVMESIRDCDFCVLVTEPTPFGLHDLRLAVETVRLLNIPCGVVINRAGVGDTRVDEYCYEENLPVLLTIPLDMEIACLYSRGVTLAEGVPEWQPSFIGLYQRIAEMVDERSCCPER